MKRHEIAARRKKETEAVAKFAGISYDVWDIRIASLLQILKQENALYGLFGSLLRMLYSAAGPMIIMLITGIPPFWCRMPLIC